MAIGGRSYCSRNWLLVVGIEKDHPGGRWPVRADARSGALERFPDGWENGARQRHDLLLELMAEIFWRRNKKPAVKRGVVHHNTSPRYTAITSGRRSFFPFRLACSFVYVLPQPFKISVDDLPEDRHIHAKILMDHSVPQTNHLTPGNVGVLFLHTLRQLIGGLSDHAKISHHGINGLMVTDELLEGQPLRVPLNLFDRLDDILKKKIGLSSRHTEDLFLPV